MNLHNDLMKVQIAHDCSQCRQMCGRRIAACESFIPKNASAFMDYVVYALRETTPLSSEKKLKRYPVPDKNAYDDKLPTQDHYYVILINDVLSQIRKGHCDYVFSLEQMRDVIRFEPHITAKYITEAGSYKIKLDK